MARTNYSFEKRQRELAKKRKKEEKAAAKKAGAGGEDEAMTPNEAALALAQEESDASPDAGDADQTAAGDEAAAPR